MRREAQARTGTPAISYLYNMSRRSPKWSDLSSTWNKPIGGLSYPFTFTDLAVSLGFPPSLTIKNAEAFADSIRGFYYSLRNTLTSPTFNNMLTRSRDTLLAVVKASPVRQIKPTDSLTDLGKQSHPTPEEGESKYNPSGTSWTQPAPLTQEQAQRSRNLVAPVVPMGHVMPVYKMQYQPGHQKMGERHKKILRQAQGVPQNQAVPQKQDSHGAYDTDIKSILEKGLMGMKKDIDKADLPSLEEFVGVLKNTNIPEEKRMAYFNDISQKADDVQKTMAGWLNKMYGSNESQQPKQGIL